jgi:large subunit ribosomal protein L6
MSRIGRAPIAVPPGVTVDVGENNHVVVKGPRGTLEQDLPADMQIVREDGTLRVERPTEAKKHKALHGLTRSLLANMVTGVTGGFEKRLEIQGVGYRAVAAGPGITLSVGFSHQVNFPAPPGITLTVEAPTRLVVAGMDKQVVGETAARIRRVRPPEPYKGKGIRYADEVVRRKAGKAGGKKK